MAFNVKLAKKVRKAIKEEPRRLRMSTWGRKLSKKDMRSPTAPPCGTVACLAGWTVLCALPEMKNFRGKLSDFVRRKRNTTLPDLAAQLLGLDWYESAPFWNFGWKATDVIRWLDNKITKAEGASRG